MCKNRLEIDRHDFVQAMKTFNVRSLPRSAMLAFEAGFLSIEAAHRLATMRAVGEWHGRARFTSNLLRALARVPPDENPVVVLYAEEQLRIGSIVVECKWQVLSKAFIRDVTKPSVLDLVAMDQTFPRSEIHGTGLATRIAEARLRLAANIHEAAKLLKDAEITEADLFTLLDRQIRRRFDRL